MKPRQHTFHAPNPGHPNSHHKLAWYEWGDSHNPQVAICVHGLSRNARDFDYLAQRLAKTHRVIAVDVVGRGKSEWLQDPKQYNYTTYVADILALLKHLEIKQVDWMGTSMGGIIGMLIAAEHPDLIRRMVLNDIGPVIPGKALERIVEYVTTMPSYQTIEDAEKGLRKKLQTFGIREDEHWQHLLEHSFFKNDEGKHAYSYDPRIVAPPSGKPIADVEFWPIWHAITCPMLILRGTMSDILLPAVVQQMRKSNAVKHVVEWENIGHAPALMDDYQIREIVEFLV